MRLLTAQQHITRPEGIHVLELAHEADPRTLNLAGVQRIDLHFPHFTDGRAHSQAHLLRRRIGFTGEIRATGDVLVDQLPLLARNGFTHAVLRADQDLDVARRQLQPFPGYYQGDALNRRPHLQEADR